MVCKQFSKNVEITSLAITILGLNNASCQIKMPIFAIESQRDMICSIGLKELPFVQDDRQIIYTEGTYCATVNKFIVKNFAWIKRLFDKYSFDFCYLPKLSDELLKPEIINYYAPYINKEIENIKFDNGFILDYMVHTENKVKIKPMLLFHSKETEVKYPEAACQYRAYILDLPEDLDRKNSNEQSLLLKSLFSKAAEEISDYISDSEPFVHCREYDMACEALSYAELDFDRESWQLIKEIRERIALLHKRGICDEMLRRAIKGNEKLSRLVITHDYRILLPDYNMEVGLRPLPKAVYLLFLRHPEGILFKSLPDYRVELAELYLKFRGGELSDREYQSVLDVTNPFNNSINEKCARIREAFLDKFDVHLAHYYCIDGHKGEPKRIALPTNLIEWK